MSRPAYSSTSQGRHHPDFQLKWVQDILDHPDVTADRQAEGEPESSRWKGQVFNSLFTVTLAHETGLRAVYKFQRPCSESDAVSKHEDCCLMSLGTGLNGRPGRGHGGLTSLLMDQGTGGTAVRSRTGSGDDPPATATLSVDYLAPMDNPGVFLMRTWVIELQGRKVWVKGAIQNGDGVLCATAKALFIHPRPTASL